MERSFPYVILTFVSFISFSVGLLLLIFTEKVSLITMYGSDGMITSVIQQFLGSSLMLVGILTFLIKKIKNEIILYYFILAYNIYGFINLYLIFSFSALIQLPIIYFTAQALMQLVLLIALIEQVKRKK
tara:strand:- start:58 stop:444 length:387 start_codon:yes stop_codon:yes gene_type:complete